MQLGHDIHAVTGATLSSEAMTESVKTAIALLKSRLTGQNP
ncbi:MAG: FMN-binding protein [Planctomycetes bacterium]|nr:FMN-binding protein [Planctomycetota bacterium]